MIDLLVLGKPLVFGKRVLPLHLVITSYSIHYTKLYDEEQNYFSLSFGGRTILCRESLSELTTAVAMSICDDKRVTSRLLAKVGLCVPQQRTAASRQENEEFLAEHKRIVVKPARGEQGAGVSVDIREAKALALAIERARAIDADVILERLIRNNFV